MTRELDPFTKIVSMILLVGFSAGAFIELASRGRVTTRDKVSGMVVFVLAALAISVFKHSNQLFYGYIECVVATISAWRILSSLSGAETERYLAIAGAIYIMSRGINNVWDASVTTTGDMPIAIRRFIYGPYE